MLKRDMFSVGTFAIIMDDQERVLFCHRRDYDLWNLPGGTVEEGESPWNAIIREVKEETGLDVDVVQLTGVYNKPNKNEIVFSFLCGVRGGCVTLNDEADQIEYFHLKDIPKNTSLKQVERIQDYFSDKNKVHFKSQVGPSSIDIIRNRTLS